MAGYSMLDNERVKTHYDPLKEFSISELQNMVSNLLGTMFNSILMSVCGITIQLMLTLRGQA